MTIVAACIRAETGVGPSIASGSQTCSGNWADLPTAPMKSISSAQNSLSESTVPLREGSSNITENSSDPYMS